MTRGVIRAKSLYKTTAQGLDNDTSQNSSQQQLVKYLNWSDIANILAEASPVTHRRLKIPLLDTVFLETDDDDDNKTRRIFVTSWVATNKKGEVHQLVRGARQSNGTPTSSQWLSTRSKPNSNCYPSNAGDVAAGGCNSVVEVTVRNVRDKFERLAKKTNQKNSTSYIANGSSYQNGTLSALKHLSLDDLNNLVNEFDVDCPDELQFNVDQHHALVNKSHGDSFYTVRVIHRKKCTSEQSNGDDPASRKSTNSSSMDFFVVRKEPCSQNSGLTPPTTLEDSSLKYDKSLKRELATFVISAKQHIESVLREKDCLIDSHFGESGGSKVIALVVDFVLDIRSQIWLSQIPILLVSKLHHVEKENSSRIINYELSKLSTLYGVSEEKRKTNVSNNGHTSNTRDNKDEDSSSSKLSEARLEESNNDKEVPVEDVSSPASAKLAAYRKHILSLEAEITTLTSKANILEEAESKASSRVEELINTKLKMEREFNREREKVEGDHNKAILSLEVELSSNKAQLASLKAKITDMEIKGGVKSTMNDQAEAHVRDKLLLKIKELHEQISTSAKSWNEEKRRIESRHSSALQDLASQYRTVLSSERLAKASLEDTLVEQKDAFKRLQRDQILLRQKFSDLDERFRLTDDLNDKSNTVHDHKETKLAQSDSVESPSLNLSDVGAINALNNKVDYLKAQLLSESNLKDEYVSIIEQLRVEKEELASKCRSKLRDLEVSKNQEIVHLQEERGEVQKSHEIEILDLKKSISSLNANLADMENKFLAAEKAEKLGADLLSKERTRIKTLYEELAIAKADSEMIRDELQFLKESKEGIAFEGMVRRLDNERHYLKNQLENEVAAKYRLQDEITNLQKVQGDKLASKQVELDNLNGQLRERLKESNCKEIQLKNSNQSLLSELQFTKEQLGEVKDAFVKTRDLLRIEQASAEQMRATSSRLAQELRASQEEIKNEKQIASDTIVRHAESTKAIGSTLKEAEALRSKEVSHYQSETQNALIKVQEAKQSMLLLQEKLNGQQMLHSKSFGAFDLFSTLVVLIKQKRACAFNSWRFSIQLANAKQDYKVELCNALDKERKLQDSQLQSTINEERENFDKEITRYKEERERDMTDLERKLDLKLKHELNMAQELSSGLLRQRLQEERSAYNEKVHNLEEAHKAALSRQIEIEKQSTLHLRKELSREKKQALQEVHDEYIEKNKVSLVERDTKWSKILADTEKRIHSEKEKQLSTVRHNHRVELKRLESVLTKKYCDERKEFEERSNELLVNEIALCTEKHKAMIEEINRNKEEEIKCLNEKIKNEGTEFDRKLNTVLAEQRQAFDKELEIQLSNFNDRLDARHLEGIEEGKKMSQSIHDEKISREVSRWKDVVARLEAQGEEERELYDAKKKEALVEIKQIEYRSKQEVQNVEQKAKSDMKRLAEEHAKSLKERESVWIDNKNKELEKARHEAKVSSEMLVMQCNIDREKAIERCKAQCAEVSQREIASAVNKAVVIERDIASRLQADLDNSRQRWSEDRKQMRAELDNVRKTSEEQLRSQVDRTKRELESLRISFEETRTHEMGRLRSKMVDDKEECLKLAQLKHEKTLRNAEETIKKETEYKLKEALVAAESAFAEQVEQWKAKNDSIISEKGVLEQRLSELMSELEDAEDKAFDLETKTVYIQRREVLRQFYLIGKLYHEKEKHNEDIVLMNSQHNVVLKRQEEKAKNEYMRIESQVSKLELHIREYRKKCTSIQDILFNYKKNDIIDFKSKSEEIAKEVISLVSKKKLSETKRDNKLEEMKEMETSLHELENQISAHSRTSAILDGRLNLTHARRKRRLDEEYEEHLQAIENKRKEIEVIEKEIERWNNIRLDKESTLKKLEKNLTQVLIEQQKKLLQLLK